VSPFYSHLECKTGIDIGTSGAPPSLGPVHNYVILTTDLKPDFHGDISTLREQTVNRWREFVVTAVLADYQNTSRHAHSHNDCEIPESLFLCFDGLIDPSA